MTVRARHAGLPARRSPSLHFNRFSLSRGCYGAIRQSRRQKLLYRRLARLARSSGRIRLEFISALLAISAPSTACIARVVIIIAVQSKRRYIYSELGRRSKDEPADGEIQITARAVPKLILALFETENPKTVSGGGRCEGLTVRPVSRAARTAPRVNLTRDNIPRVRARATAMPSADKTGAPPRRLNFNPLITSFNRKLPGVLNSRGQGEVPAYIMALCAPVSRFADARIALGHPP